MPWESLTSLIEDKLNELVPSSEPARHILFAPCKRLRPLLTLITAQTLGCSIEKALVPACAIELIHTYSLIHDDLPCMDDDDVRRGRPSVHKMYGEAQAILAGDYLLTYAFQILSECKNLNPQQRIDLIRILSQHAGNEGMIGGQVLDITLRDQKISFETLKQMHLGKTAALITACFEFGGIVAETSKETMHILQNAGTCFGLAFQAMDDILDSNDNNEINLVSHLGKDAAIDYTQELLIKSENYFAQLPGDATELNALLHAIISMQNFAPSAPI